MRNLCLGLQDLDVGIENLDVGVRNLHLGVQNLVTLDKFLTGARQSRALQVWPQGLLLIEQ